MTKNDETANAAVELIDLGAASTETHGAIPFNSPDEQQQHLPKVGLSAD